jgi:hypothetical protein
MEASSRTHHPMTAEGALADSCRIRWVIVGLLRGVGFVFFVLRTNSIVAGRLMRDELGFTQAGLGDPRRLHVFVGPRPCPRWVAGRSFRPSTRPGGGHPAVGSDR